jgi:hypothetical protein
VYALLEDSSPSVRQKPVRSLDQFAFSNASLLRVINMFDTVVMDRAIDQQRFARQGYQPSAHDSNVLDSHGHDDFSDDIEIDRGTCPTPSAIR